MAIKYTICVILMIKLVGIFLLTEFCVKNEKGTTAAIHSRFLQEETMTKTGRYSAVQVRANPPGRAKLASKLADQRGPARTTPAAIYLQQRVKVRTWIFFYKNFTRHKHTHPHTVCLDNQSWEQVLSDQWFLFIKRERWVVQAHVQCHFYVTFTWLFLWAPPGWFLVPPVPPH